MNKAVFLDRDGVINDNKKPVNQPKDLILYPFVYEALSLLRENGFLLFIITNQGGIERGYFTQEDLKSIHDHLLNLLRKKNVSIDDIAFCPHFDTKCNCRKPLPGMILKLAKKHNVDLSSSFMIGDRDVDILAGKSAHCTTIKIGKPFKHANYTVDNLLKATQLILSL